MFINIKFNQTAGERKFMSVFYKPCYWQQNMIDNTVGWEWSGVDGKKVRVKNSNIIRPHHSEIITTYTLYSYTI
jgi:hypothetical protein